MNPKEIKESRFSHQFKEAVADAISSLNDKTISTLTVVDVKVSRGKSDATIYLNGVGYDKEEREKIISRLKKASGYISKHSLATLGKYRVPTLKFVMDDTTEALSKMDELFKRIENERRDNKKN